MPDAPKPASLPARIAGQWSRYRKAAAWIFRDAWSSFPRQMAGVLALNGLYLAFQLGAVGLLARYLHALESGKPIVLAGLELPAARESSLVLVAVAGLCLLMFFAAFGALFAAESLMLRVWALYEEKCAARAIFLIAAQGGHPRAEPWRESFRKLIGSDARYCGLVTRISLRLFAPVATWAATFGALVYLDAGLTLTLMALVLACLPVLYRINLRGASHTMAIERRAKKAAETKRRAVDGMADRIRDGARPGPALLREVDLKGVRPHLDAQIGKRRTMEESRLVTSTLMGVAIFAILLQKGGQILSTGGGWAQLAAYLVILRINLNALTGSARLFSSINRYYPHFSRYIAFVRHMESLLPQEPAHPFRLSRSSEGAAEDDDDDDDA